MGYVVRSHTESTESARVWARLFFVIGTIVAIWIIAPSTAGAEEPTVTVAETTETVDPTETVAETTETVAETTENVEPTETVAETTETVAETTETVEPTETVAETTTAAESTSTPASSTASDATGSAAAPAQAAGGHLSDTPRDASDAASAAAEDVTRAVSDAAEDATSGVSTSVEEASQTATRTVNGATEAATGAADRVTQTVKDAGDAGLSTVVDAGDALVRSSEAVADDLSVAVRAATSEPVPIVPSTLLQLDGSDPVPVADPGRGAPRPLWDPAWFLDRERASLSAYELPMGVGASSTAGGAVPRDDSASDTMPNPADTSRQAHPTSLSVNETMRGGSSFQDFAAVLVAIMIALGFARWSRREAESRYSPVFLSLAGNPG